MTDINDTTTTKPKRAPSLWATALKEFNSTRPAGAKFVFPKKDTAEYLKVKEISDRLKKNLTVVIPDTKSEPAVKVKKPRKPRLKKDEVLVVTKDEQSV